MGYNNLDRIKTVFFRLSHNIVIYHIVKVAYKDKEGNRKYGHTEYIYKSNQYNDTKMVSSINLNYESYFEIVDITKSWTDNRSIKIGAEDLYKLVEGLEKVANWFDSDSILDLFTMDKGMIKLKEEKLGIGEEIHFREHICLTLYPIPRSDENGNNRLALMCLINSTRCSSIVEVNSLKALLFNLRTANLFMYGLLVMNYIGRPDFGQFAVNMEDEYNMSNEITQNKTESNIKKPVDNHDKYFSRFFRQ